MAIPDAGVVASVTFITGTVVQVPVKAASQLSEVKCPLHGATMVLVAALVIMPKYPSQPRANGIDI
jgi:hypothetical protein